MKTGRRCVIVSVVKSPPGKRQPDQDNKADSSRLKSLGFAVLEGKA